MCTSPLCGNLDCRRAGGCRRRSLKRIPLGAYDCLSTMSLPGVFFAPMALVVDRPYLALAPALLFGFGYTRLRPPAPRSLLVATVLWALYAAYETYMFFWSKTVVAPIRVDLLLVTPILYLVTVAGALGWWREARRRSRAAGA